ncbi:disulfide bond formation protein B [Sinorhizobium medicae]|uniref:Disulfide bond formation protein B n=1 Tax=Sinorhizobium medicae TaxID=110321 RepID=A0A508WVS8_9HYPH|nr:disulfide bond formation protein B [Sinorhizobium medicae]MDX0423645.1 disulfide bond formation protein B [Sinorhizobium medicae]MDX0522077.1 disulfide bond formation protein B [Sinorhizobium medicae]MDX0546314.1 disulfide bond formation protein B [Sinorhizobium medicae]MDX0633894.1 disulfide bond formation protein B [Sinorhizobium medicae]MDX0714048.1 disulfide bond formation protein B [Sinorhizobium medicae]
MVEAPLVQRRQYLFALLVTIGMAATVGIALGFEHFGGYIPCALCLLQRDPYYYGIPLGVAAVLTSALKLPSWTTRTLLLIIGILMLIGAGLGVYHAGAEWHFWEGPSTCATTAQGVSSDVGDLLGDLDAKHAPSCTDAALRVFGLSFAGWNVVASLVLAAIALSGARRA